MAKDKAKKKMMGGRASGKKVAVGVYIVLFLIAVSVVPAVVALSIVGLAPTIVSMLVNQHSHRFQHNVTIFAFNMIGMLPFLGDVVARPQNVHPVTDILTSSYTYIVMYGAAGAGAVAVILAPQVAAVFLQFSAIEQLRRIKAEQERMITEWGEEVTGVSKEEATEAS